MSLTQWKSIPLRKNIINITKSVKQNHKTKRRTLYEIRRGMCVTETGGGGGGEERKELKKDRKGMLITENYKNVYNGHGHGVSWEKPHE
jgi:hypothetical protein